MTDRKEYNRVWKLNNKDRINQYSKEYYRTHKKEAKEYNKMYRINNLDKVKVWKKKHYNKYKDKINQKSKKRFKVWYPKNKDKVKIKNKLYNMTNNEYRKKQAKKYKENNKVKIFEAYGNKCNHCGDKNSYHLTIDHIMNDGSNHKNESGRRLKGHTMYLWLIKNKFPKDNFQLLCWNCNCAKGTYGFYPDALIPTI